MTNTNCFAYDIRFCRVLTKRICDKQNCGFYKTEKQYKEDLEKYPPYDYKNKNKNDKTEVNLSGK